MPLHQCTVYLLVDALLWKLVPAMSESRESCVTPLYILTLQNDFKPTDILLSKLANRHD